MPFSVFLWWLLLIWGAGWLGFPVALRLTGYALPDGGLALGRIGFLTLWSVIAFWLGHAGVSVALCAWLYLVLAGACLAFGWGERTLAQREWKARRRALLGVEAAFLATFLVFWTLRGFWSDTSGSNGEKGMDSVLVATLSRAQRLPPPNPYAAGARLESYYVLGHLEAALLTRASGTTTRWSYNLMCATLPALCVSALFSLAWGLTQKWGGGLFVSFAVLGLGTLQPLYQWIHPDGYSRTLLLRLKFFDVSRVQPYAINEFPWFTFNQADLHAHYFDFPIEIALMTLAWALCRASDWRRRVQLLGVCSVFLGAQILTNTWDFPAFALLIGLAFLLAPCTRTERFALWSRRSLAPADRTQQAPTEAEPAAPQRAGIGSRPPQQSAPEREISSAHTDACATKPQKGASQRSNPSTERAGAAKKAKTAALAPAETPAQRAGASANRTQENAATSALRALSANRSPNGSEPAPQRASSDEPTQENATLAKPLWPRRVLWLLLALGGAIGLALPYLLGINTAARGPQLLTLPASPLRKWLLMWAPFVLTWAAFGTAWLFGSKRRAWLVLGALGTFALLAAWLGQRGWGFPSGNDWDYPTGLEVQPVPTPESLSVWFAALNPARLVIPILLVSAWLAVRGARCGRGALRFASILALAGLFALLWSETTWAGFLGDPHFPVATDFKRQDTIFKFGLQTWFLWGTAASAGAYLSLKRWPLALKLLFVPVVLVMATSSLVDTVGRAHGFDPALRQNWDGWAHLSRGEQDAARWLELHTPPDQNLLEAEQKEGGDFSDYTRYTHATGIPTIIGPQSHSFYWSPSPLRLKREEGEGADEFVGRRAGEQFREVFKRKEEARTAFTTPDSARRLDILKRYGVRTLVWGQLERAQYGEVSHAFLERDLRLAARFGFEPGDDPAHRVEIWRVP